MKSNLDHNIHGYCAILGVTHLSQLPIHTLTEALCQANNYLIIPMKAKAKVAWSCELLSSLTIHCFIQGCGGWHISMPIEHAALYRSSIVYSCSGIYVANSEHSLCPLS